jgi:type VI secretion system ImpJ/VasE family protein
MSSDLDVLWVEGSLLTAHHLQVASLRSEALVEARLRVLSLASHGVASLEIDDAALESGEVVVREVRAVLRDGSPVHHTSTLSCPLSRVRGASTTIYLALPARGRGSEVDPGAGQPARYEVVTVPVADRHGDAGTRTLQLGRLLPLLQTDDDSSEGFDRLPILRVERLSGRAWRRDPSFIPRYLRADASPELRAFAEGALGTMQARLRRVLEEAGAATDLARTNPVGFWLVQTLNTSIASLRHALSLPHASPEDWYGAIVTAAGSLCSFHADRDAAALPTFRADDIHGSFSAITALLAELLQVEPPSRFAEVALVREVAVWSGEIPAIDNPSRATVLLLFHTKDDVPLTRGALEGIKVGSPGRATYYAQAGLPGVTLRLLDGPPAGAPRRTGAWYTSVRTRGARWTEVASSNQIAVHAPRAVGLTRVQLIVVFGGA